METDDGLGKDPFLTSNSNQSDAPVRLVTVFQEGAFITRTWTKSLQPGIHHLRFNNFIQQYVSNTLRVNVHGAASLQEISDCASSDALNSSRFLQERAEKLVELQRQKRELETQLSFAEKRLETWEAYRLVVMGVNPTILKLFDQSFNTNLIKTISPGPPATIFKEGAFVDLHDFLWKYEGEYVRLHAALQQAQENLRAINEQQNQYINHALPPFRKISDIKIVLDAAAAGPVRVDISYEAKEAGWTPKYDLRFKVAEKQVQVHYYAQIQQWTGEDWNDVTITVAARNLNAARGQIQQHSQQSYEFSRPAPHSRSSSRGPTAPSSQVGASRSGSLETLTRTVIDTEQADTPNPTTTTNKCRPLEETHSISPFSTALDSPVSLGHGKSSFILLGKFNMDVTFRHFVRPQTDGNVELRAVFNNQCMYSLLGGPVNLFVDGDYFGHTFLTKTNPQDEIITALGNDPQIELMNKPRTKTSKPIAATSDGNFRIEEEHSNECNIRNGRKHTISVFLVEPLPRSGDDNVKIAIIFPKMTKRQTENGLMEQLVDVPAGATRTVKSIYKIDIPHSMHDFR